MSGPTDRAFLSIPLGAIAVPVIFAVLLSCQAAFANQSGSDPKLLEVLDRSEGMMRKGAFEPALAEMDRAIAFHTRASHANLARLHLQRGIVLVLLDRPAQARTAFNLALCHDPAIDPSSFGLSPTTARLFDEARLSPCTGLLPAENGKGAAAGAEVTRRRSPWPAVLLVGGGALLAGGSVLGVLALQAEDDASEAYQVDAGAARDRANNLAMATDLTLGAGVLAMGTGLVLLLLEEEDSPAEQQARILPFVAGGAGLSLALSF